MNQTILCNCNGSDVAEKTKCSLCGVPILSISLEELARKRGLSEVKRCNLSDYTKKVERIKIQCEICKTMNLFLGVKDYANKY